MLLFWLEFMFVLLFRFDMVSKDFAFDFLFVSTPNSSQTIVGSRSLTLENTFKL